MKGGLYWKKRLKLLVVRVMEINIIKNYFIFISLV